METIRNFLSDPIWGGIQGIVALAMFLLYLWEKREQWSPQLKKSGVVFRFIAITLLFVASGWVLPSLLCLIPLFFLDSLSTEPLTLVAIKTTFMHNLSALPRALLIFATTPTLAAMTSEDPKRSEKRAMVTGAFTLTFFSAYALFNGGWAEWSGGDAPQATYVISTLASIVLVAVNILVLISLGAILGSLSSIGVHRLRTFIQQKSQSLSHKH